jgi:diguanylate cyclase (GGDEF)-like protein
MTTPTNRSQYLFAIAGSYLADSLLLLGFALAGAGKLAIPYTYLVVGFIVTNIGRYILLRNSTAASERATHLAETAGGRANEPATHDALTSLANRTLFAARLEEAVEDGAAFAVAVLDLDRFKFTNDSQGYGAGDSMLRMVAQRLLASTRTNDTVARSAGDEFLILIRQVRDAPDIETLSARWMDALSGPYGIRGAQLHVSASIGIARYPEDASNGCELLARAEEAMSHAKRGGRNRCCLYDAQRMGLSRERPRLEADLQQAIANCQFELLYQPKVDVAGGDMRSVEALLRWQHPTRGRLLPGEFMSIAEDAGLILSIGAWMIDEVCRQAKIWKEQDLPFLRIAVNVSPAQFRQPDFAGRLQDTLSRHCLQPSYLELQISEATLMDEAEKSVLLLEQLSRLGVVVAIDDFGTGYSSMSYLQRFPIDQLKIDLSFVHRLPNNAGDASIVRAIISLAHGLRLKVIAKGVESAEQLAILKRMGCDQYQGSVQSAAVPATDIALLLAAQRTQAANDSLVEPAASRLARLVRSNY